MGKKELKKHYFDAPCHCHTANVPELSCDTVLFLPRLTKFWFYLMDGDVVTSLKRRCGNRLYERAFDLLESFGLWKLYQVHVLRVVEWMSNIRKEVDSIIIHNSCCAAIITQFSNQNSAVNTQEEHTLHKFIKEDYCICTLEN